MPRSRVSQAKAAAGVALLEVLVSVLIFSFGVLALVGLQTALAKEAKEAEFRTDASLLIDNLIGRMYASQRTPDALSTQFATGQPGYLDWLAAAQAALPQLEAQGTTVTVTPVNGGPGSAPSSRIEITLAWRHRAAPQGATLHQLTSVAQIGG